jgi:hypothetical protein
MVSAAIKSLLDQAAANLASKQNRDYLGASILGWSCMRKIQYAMRNTASDTTANTFRIFERGHLFEDMVANYLVNADFTLLRPVYGEDHYVLSFMEGKFGGTIDGLVTDGPEIEGLQYPFIWENKAVGAKSWKVLTKEVSLEERNKTYATQIAIYQAMLGYHNPALLTVVNSDTMEIHAEFIELDRSFAQKSLDKATIILAAPEDEWLPKIANDSDYFECRMCNYKKTCWE